MKFIGMDAHSRNSTFAVLAKNGRFLAGATTRTNESELLDFVRSIRGPKALTFEEGVMSQWLYLLLKDEVDSLVVCQPLKRRGPKTDKIDAREIADLLRVGRLKSVFHTDDELVNIRTLISGYDDVTKEFVRAKNRYKALYREVAIPTEGNKFYESPEPISLLKTSEQRFVAGSLYDQLVVLDQLLQQYRQRFEANARKYKPVRLMMSIPGIGPVRANQLVGIIVTPYRFPNKYHLYSYAKLTPHVRMSDGRPYGKNAARGQTTLKALFKSAFMHATKGNNAFRRKYISMIDAGIPHKNAKNAVTKMLAAAVLGVWKSGTKYDDHKMEVTRRRNQRCHSGTESPRA